MWITRAEIQSYVGYKISESQLSKEQLNAIVVGVQTYINNKLCRDWGENDTVPADVKLGTIIYVAEFLKARQRTTAEGLSYSVEDERVTYKELTHNELADKYLSHYSLPQY